MNVITYISKRKKTAIYFAVIFLLVAFCSKNSNAQYKEDYVVIKTKGQIPYDYLNYVRGETRVNIKNTEQLTRQEREEFRDATNTALRNFFVAGQIYFNDPLTEYVRLVGNKLTEGTDAAEKIQFFVSKSSEINATSWQTGTIIVNIGLLSQLENEAQLAYVLAHEIAHFNEQHPYKQYARYLKSNREVKSSELARRFSEHIDYNLQYEIEADSIALQTIVKLGYDTEEVPRTLQLLLHYEPKEMISPTELFSSSSFQLAPTQMCRYAEYNGFKKSSSHDEKGHLATKHISIRLKNITRIIDRDYPQLFAFKNDGQYKYDRKLFSNMKNMAHFEVVHQSALQANYLKSTFEAMVLMRKFPQNSYLHIKISENLYQIHHYNQIGLLNRLFFDNKKIQEDDYAKLCCLINNISEENLRKMTYGFIYKSYQDYPTNEMMLITMAKATEEIISLEKALPFYQKYVKIFPDGMHYGEAKRKSK